MRMVIDSQKIANSASSIAVFSSNIVSSGLLALFAILLMTVACMSAVLPFLVVIIFGAGHGDEVLQGLQFWKIFGLSFLPIIIVLGFLSKK